MGVVPLPAVLCWTVVLFSHSTACTQKFCSAGWIKGDSTVPLCSTGVIDTVDASKFSSISQAVQEVRDRLIQLTKPLVVTQLLPDQKAAFERNALLAKLSSHQIVTKSPFLTGVSGPERRFSEDEFQLGEKMTVPNYLERLRSSREKPPPELFENTRSAPEMVASYTKLLRLGDLRSAVNEFFNETMYSFRVLSIGAHGEGLPFHTHNKAMLIHLHGAKVWHWVPPPYSFSERLPNSTALHRETVLVPAQWSDEMKATLKSVPEYIRCRAEAGHIVFFPAGWKHATENIGESVSFGAQVGGKTMFAHELEAAVRAPDSYLGPEPHSTHQLSTLAGMLVSAELSGTWEAKTEVGEEAKRLVHELLLRVNRQDPYRYDQSAQLLQSHLEKGDLHSSLTLFEETLTELHSLHKAGIISDDDYTGVTFMVATTFHRGLMLGTIDLALVLDKGIRTEREGELIPLLQVIADIYKRAIEESSGAAKVPRDMLAWLRETFEGI